MTDDSPVSARVNHFESMVANLPSMSNAERTRFKEEVVRYYVSLDPVVRALKHAAVGAGAALVFPGIGLVAGAMFGFAIGVFRASEVEMKARDRLKTLIDKIG